MDQFITPIVKCNYVGFVKVRAKMRFYEWIVVVIKLNASNWPLLLIKVAKVVPLLSTHLRSYVVSQLFPREVVHF